MHIQFKETNNARLLRILKPFTGGGLGLFSGKWRMKRESVPGDSESSSQPLETHTFQPLSEPPSLSPSPFSGSSSVEPPRVTEYMYAQSPSPVVAPTPPQRQKQPNIPTTIPESANDFHVYNSIVRPSRLPAGDFLADSSLENNNEPDKISSTLQASPGLSVENNGTVVRTASRNSNERGFPKFITKSEVPKPPEEVINRIEDMRQPKGALDSESSALSDSIANSSEAAYQVEVTPPIRQRTPPPQILIDPIDTEPFSPAAESSVSGSASTWASSTSRL